MTELSGRPRLRRVAGVMIWLLAILLFWIAVRSIPLENVFATLRELSWIQILLLTIVNTLVVLCLSGRWWWILRGLQIQVPYLWLSLYRLAGFSISYFTPGPQFGGEPLQVIMLQKRHSVSGSIAAASVTLDKAIELIGNFTFLLFGVITGLRLQFLPGDAGKPLLYAAISMLVLPIGFLAAAWSGRNPLASLFSKVPESVHERFPRFSNITSGLLRVEAKISTFCCDRPQGLIGALAFSAFTWLGLIGEYWLMQKSLGLNLDLWQTITLLTAARLAFLTPLPGGVGALELSQTLAVRTFGYSSTVGLSLGLLIRGRDMAFGLLGLIIGGWLSRDISITPRSSTDDKPS